MVTHCYSHKLQCSHIKLTKSHITMFTHFRGQVLQWLNHSMIWQYNGHNTTCNNSQILQCPHNKWSDIIMVTHYNGKKLQRLHIKMVRHYNGYTLQWSDITIIRLNILNLHGCDQGVTYLITRMDSENWQTMVPGQQFTAHELLCNEYCLPITITKYITNTQLNIDFNPLTITN